MTRIVTTTYRYKRPPRKRTAVVLEVPAVVMVKRGRRPDDCERAAAEVPEEKSPRSRGEAAQSLAQPPANDDRKPAIVTIKRKSRFGDVPDMRGHRRRGEAADALWRELVRRVRTGHDG
jgi:hypothetical protein